MPRGAGVSSALKFDAPIGGNTDWRIRAACRWVDAEDFHPIGYDWNTGINPERAERAKAVCRRCPVIWECQQDAQQYGDPWAIRAGTTPEERSVPKYRAKANAS